MGIPKAYLLKLKAQKRSMNDSQMCRLRNLEKENSQLKKVVAALSLDKHILHLHHFIVVHFDRPFHLY